jgi:hypothetical protein
LEYEENVSSYREYESLILLCFNSSLTPKIINVFGQLVLTLHKPEGTRRVGTPDIRWLNSAEEDLKAMGVRNWGQMSQDPDQCRPVVKEAKVYHGL